MNYCTYEWWTGERQEFEESLEGKLEKELERVRRSGEGNLATLERKANRSLAEVHQKYNTLQEKFNGQERKLHHAITWKTMVMAKVDRLEESVERLEESVRCLGKEVSEVEDTLDHFSRDLDCISAQVGAPPEPVGQEGQGGSNPVAEEGQGVPEPPSEQGQDLEEEGMKLDAREMLLNDIDEGVYISEAPIRKRNRKEESEGSSEESDPTAKQAKPLKLPPTNASRNTKTANPRTRASEKGKGKKK